MHINERVWAAQCSLGSRLSLARAVPSAFESRPERTMMQLAVFIASTATMNAKLLSPCTTSPSTEFAWRNGCEMMSRLLIESADNPQNRAPKRGDESIRCEGVLSQAVPPVSWRCFVALPRKSARSQLQSSCPATMTVRYGREASRFVDRSSRIDVNPGMYAPVVARRHAGQAFEHAAEIADVVKSALCRDGVYRRQSLT